MAMDEKGMVDAIEDGRIVRVSEEYARREGLMIIRRPQASAIDSPKAQQQMKLTPRLRGERKAYFDIDKYRRPWHNKNEILASLLPNFNWLVASRRKDMNLSRRQLASELNVADEDLKMIENGLLPQNDYVLINKLETRLKINLRKDKIASLDDSRGFDVNRAIHQPKWAGRVGKAKEVGSAAEKLVSDEIEIFDEEEKSEDKSE